MEINGENATLKWMIWGSNGFVGQHFTDIFRTKNQVIRVFRNKNSKLCVQTSHSSEEIFDLSAFGIRNILEKYRPNFLVNCAGLASVDKCAQNSHEAYISNSLLPKFLASECMQLGTRFVHISTDAVFGQDGIFFSESEIPIPNSIYSKTKYHGEELALQLNPESLIIRTRPLGTSIKRTTLVDYFLWGFLQGNPIPGHKNVFFTPIYISDLALSIEKLVLSSESGIWNLVGSERISKFDVGVFILKHLGLPTNYLFPVEFANVEEESKRSLDTSLSNTKYSDKFGGIPSVFEGLERAILRERNIER
jgi:dTDP-4-dehydrorhamnose reductase